MKIFNTAKQYLQWREVQSKAIGFVPTLGALHRGHFSLIKQSTKQCELTAVSIFLNPTQFAIDEDLNKYPQTLDADIDALVDLGVDILFLPNTEEMYQKTPDVKVPETPLFKKLEGKSRPHFFFGVTTIVAKLFNIIQPTHTFFGEKDAQQLLIIKEMIQNMEYPITLIACATIRDKNGLALSSRNQYLSNQEQKQASIIYKSLMAIKQQLDLGEKDPDILKNLYTQLILKENELDVDYISIASKENLKEVTKIHKEKLLVSTAVFFKKIRLIDNFIYSSET